MIHTQEKNCIRKVQKSDRLKNTRLPHKAYDLEYRCTSGCILGYWYSSTYDEFRAMNGIAVAGGGLIQFLSFAYLLVLISSSLFYNLVFLCNLQVRSLNHSSFGYSFLHFAGWIIFLKAMAEELERLCQNLTLRDDEEKVLR